MSDSAASPNPPKARILDVYGAFVREFGGWISIAALIELLGELDVDPQAIRSAASRMKRAGLLESRKVSGVAGYELSSMATEILDDGDTRIFRNPTDPDDSRWVVAMFSVPEAQRQDRYAIRSGLARLGFGPGPASSWIAPVCVLSEAERMLERDGLSGYVSLWRADYVGFGDAAAVAARAWDLDEIAGRYRDFVDLAQATVPDPVTGDRSDRQAFVDYLNVLSAWRPLPYLDPGLPDTVTPPDWPAAQARAQFADHHQHLRPAAMRYFVTIASG